MSKNEKLKAEIDYLKALIIFLLTALFTVIGWIVTIKNKADSYDLFLVGFAIVILSLLVFFLHRKITNKFDELSELKERK